MSNIQQSTAAANILSGERTFQNVQFATTGDPYADAISGIYAVIKACGIQLHQAPHLLEFMFKRAAAELKAYEAMTQAQQVAYPQQQFSNIPPNVGIGSVSGIGVMNHPITSQDLYRQLGLQNDPLDVP